VPELPEVETVRRGIAPQLEGRRLQRVEILDERLVAPEPPDVVARGLEDERVASVERRGKYLVLRLASGRALLVHLRMTGNVLWSPASADHAALPFERARAELDDGSLLRYTDVRRFGTWLVLPGGAGGPDADAWLAARLGPEPLGDAFTPAFLRSRLFAREAPLKTALLDQRVVAGLGNIYADEALYRARLHPRTPPPRVRGERLRALHGAIRDVLADAIEAQGASISDFRRPDGGYGSAQERFAAYGRAGEPCLRCGTPLERIVVGQRGTHFCPHCQRAPRTARRSAAAC
jgi:formamidopyrimidine-DNA glycosylase